MIIPQFVPNPIAAWVASLPQQNVGTLYAVEQSPLGFRHEYKIEAWGQLCDGSDNRGFVEDDMYNNRPFHGRGWRYISFRCVRTNGETIRATVHQKPIAGTP